MKGKKIMTIIWSLLITLLLVAIGGYFYMMDIQLKGIKLSESNVHIILSETGWATNNFELKIKYDGDASTDIKGYSYDGGKTWSRANIITVDRNKTINIVVKDRNDKLYEVKYEIENFDNEGPKVEIPDYIQVSKGSNVNLNDYVTATDDKSGLKGDLVFTPETVDTKNIGSQKINVLAIDNAGNRTSINFNVNIVEQAPAVEVEKVTIDNDKLELTVDEEKTLIGQALPKYAANKSITWESSDNNIVTVNNGQVKAVAVGEAKIIVKSSNGKTAECVVTVKEK